MATRRDIPVTQMEPLPGDGATEDASLKHLLQQLAADASDLVRQEVTLARLEMQALAANAARQAGKLALAASLAAAGALALLAFVIIALGDAIDSYWASALIVGVLLALVGGIAANSAIKKLKQEGFKPDETIGTLREDKRWAQAEIREFKRELRA